MKGRRSPLAAPAAQLAELDRVALELDFPERLREAGHWPLRPAQVEVLQLNICRRCNQTCRHCHVDAGPDRDELMSQETMESCLAALERSTIPTVDITGGAPELNPHFRWLLERCRAAGRQVMTRCNLTVLASPENEDLPELFARQKIALICSLPHARKRSTDLQRGRLAFERSIEALRRLNAVGYGDGRSGLELTLVANPIGDWLPGSQRTLEQEWKAELARNHGIRFDRLICIANMPIGRHLEWLVETGKLSDYLTRLAEAFNPRAVPGVMCRATLSVGWDGRLYDCDFNQMLELNLDERAPQHIAEFALEPLERRQIRVARHCFGCTAGAGSSCSGATT
ncbi:MAG: arsenosugar biosynthesis radical SAM (seleno)protein ArsS [Myxococcales bacterium]